jgi:hypothetical protein
MGKFRGRRVNPGTIKIVNLISQVLFPGKQKDVGLAAKVQWDNFKKRRNAKIPGSYNLLFEIL